MSRIVKRHGRIEEYDIRKLYASVYAACLAVREPVGAAELISEKVCDDVAEWLKAKHTVTSADIRRVAGQHLHAYNANAGYIYRTHRTVA